MSTLNKSSENICEFVFFLLFGGLISKCPFYRKKSFLQEDFFETNLDLSKHPQQVFWIYFSLFRYLFSIFVSFWVIGELRELCAIFWNSLIKIHGEIICQSWALLTSFYSGPIVHWSDRFVNSLLCSVFLPLQFALLHVNP